MRTTDRLEESSEGASAPLLESLARDADQLLESGQPQAAFLKLKSAIVSQPAHPEALRVLGKVFTATGCWDEADAAFRASLELNPSLVSAWLGLGLLCRERRMTQEARRCFEQAVLLRPDDPFLRSNLAVILGDSGRISESIEHFEAVLESHPQTMTAHSNLLMMLHYDPSGTPDRLRDEHRRWAQRHLPVIPDPAPGERWSGSGPIRVGFLSGDFRGHPVGRLVSALWSHWSPDEVSIHAYETGGPSDPLTKTLRQRAQVWRRLDGLGDEAAAELIRSDQTEVLVDLSGHTSGHRLGVMHYRPAPVQLTWFGYPNTTGLPSVDYRLTDIEADPPGVDDRYSERLIRLPRVGWVYQPSEPDLSVMPRPCTRGEPFTWGSLNNPGKVHPVCLSLWGRILGAVDNSRLLMLARQDDEARDRILTTLVAAGASAEQVTFVPPTSSRGYCEYYHRVDVMLDTFPYNGAVTIGDALWMGVPVLGLCGDSYHSRQAWMMAKAMGLEDWVSETHDSLVARAVAVSSNPAAIQDLSTSLRPRLQASPLMDHAGFARQLLSVLRSLQ